MIIVGDALECLRLMPTEIAHCCVTSPPYYGLRDYGVAGQVGLEPTPEAYVERMVEVFREVRRVLRNDGTLWLNIGDSYAANRTKQVVDNKHRDVGNALGFRVPAGCKPKDLIGIPWMLAFALRADGWYLRRDIIWHKPNPMPESVRDRCTTAHEYLFMLTKAERYFYDAEAIKDSVKRSWGAENGPVGRNNLEVGYGGQRNPQVGAGITKRNKRSVWTICPKPFREAHFATFPPALVEPCILAGTSAKGVCPTCEAPWVRVVERPDFTEQPKRKTRKHPAAHGCGQNSAGQAWQDWRDAHPDVTLGWRASCDHPELSPVPPTVLDPFFGAGTTGLVAQELGRDCVGIELNPDYALMAHRRIEAARPIKEAA